MEPWIELVGERLTKNELYSMRANWTARNAAPGQDWTALYAQFRAAQDDLGRILRSLGAFDGPPLQD
jgi:hypothetical protein